jgi:DNA topoisomerase-2
MYIGSVRPTVHPTQWSLSENKIVLVEDVVYPDGLLRIFIEVLSNAIDNVWRSRDAGVSCSKILVSLDTDTGQTSVWNDGLTIPIRKHDVETEIYVPELVMGHLLTSSNYDDTENRKTSGRNGYGVKLTNVYSVRFDYEGYDEERGLQYKQTWTNHMKKRKDPTIRECSKKGSYTVVRWIPDFSLFSCDRYPTDMIHVIEKICLDTAMITRIPVYFNKTRYHVKCFLDYTRHYPDFPAKEYAMLHLTNDKDESYEIVVSSSKHPSVCFTNGIYNPEGGFMIDKLENEMFRRLLLKINKKTKKNLTVRDVRPYFTFFVNAVIHNPEFNNQSKTRVLGPDNVPIQIPEKTISAIMKWEFMDRIQEVLRMKDMIQLKKTEKQNKKYKIEGFDKANFQGHPKHKKDCTLILCEGLSAKTYAVTGIQVGWNEKKGRDWFGIYALRGKLLNVKNATNDTISKNKEIGDIIKILNLRFGCDYSIQENMETLSYHKILIITDADVDGIHICSLLLNFFHTLFPSLLQRPFLYWMMTPIAKIFYTPSEVRVFYHDSEYQKTIEGMSRKPHKIRYYKGLGTSNDSEVRETFAQKVIRYVYDPETDHTMQKVFHKKNADDRKEWLTGYDPERYVLPQESYRISDYLNQELIRFSIDNCSRSIPNLYDGLKLSTRKILYAVLKKNLSHQGKSMKVAQLAGYVAEVSNYHHGEQCLYDTIIRMTHDYVGSNNVPYLFPDGQFGTRSYNGNDAANARYIFTRLSRFIDKIYRQEDSPLLHYSLDDGDLVEPDYYIPILPMILVNGCNVGIGTGWSCHVPNYNPRELRDKILQWLPSRSIDPDEINGMTPYYHGFNGTIERVDPHKFVSKGVLEKENGTWLIRELPVGMWTDKYKYFLEDLQDQKKIRNLKNYSTPNTVSFRFTAVVPFEPTTESMNLVSNILLTNMVLFTENDSCMKKYPDIHSIFDEYCHKRIAVYGLRKEKQIEDLRRTIRLLSNKLRFLREVNDKSLELFRVPEEEILKKLVEKKYDKIDGSFHYLLDLPVRFFTIEKMRQLENDLQNKKTLLQELMSKSEERLWTEDLEKIEFP